jgi:hypothetical protein
MLVDTSALLENRAPIASNVEPFGFRDGLSQPQFYASAAGRQQPTSEARALQ